MLTLVLYPYVYLLSRAAFLEQSVCVLEVSRTLGRGPYRSFFGVALPLARPAIVAGLALVLMEVLADFGTVQYFAVDTFTTGIYRTWFAMGQPVAAAQLASVLMLFVLVLMLMERWSRGPPSSTTPPAGTAACPAIACVACAAPRRWPPARCRCCWASSCGGGAAGLHLRGRRRAARADVLDPGDQQHRAGGADLGAGGHPGRRPRLRAAAPPLPVLKGAVRVASMGYAVPGSVIAIGVLIPFARLDNALDALMVEHFGISTGLLLSGTIAALVFAYLVRFLAVSFNTIEASLGKIRPNMDQASRVLGQTPSRTLVKVHAPLMLGSLLTAGLLVFVDVMKELPATLIVRPSTSTRWRFGHTSSPPTSAWPKPPPRRWRSSPSASCR